VPVCARRSPTATSIQFAILVGLSVQVIGLCDSSDVIARRANFVWMLLDRYLIVMWWAFSSYLENFKLPLRVIALFNLHAIAIRWFASRLFSASQPWDRRSFSIDVNLWNA
jgi:hypothetical protein